MHPLIFHYEQRRLENDLVILEVFDPEAHVMPFIEMVTTYPELFKYIDFPAVRSKASFMENFYDKHIRADPHDCLFAVYNKVVTSKEDDDNQKYAGIIALSATDPVNATTEIGAIISPAFQRTHVAMNAVGLTLLWTLNPPSAGGLGLRRVEWKCHAENMASRKFASKMEFDLEGIARWQRVFPGGMVALPVEELERRNGTTGEHPGRHTAIFAIVWDEWYHKRPRILALMELGKNLRNAN